MESITIKVEKELAKEIETNLKPYYSTKTEFIREAIREKLKALKKEQALLHFKNNFGKSKQKTPLEQDETLKKKTVKYFEKKLN